MARQNLVTPETQGTATQASPLLGSDGTIAVDPAALQAYSNTRLMASTSIAENMDRVTIPEVPVTLVSGTIHCCALKFFAGQPVNALGFHNGGTPANGPTHWWFGLTDASNIVRAVTADQLTAPIAASTNFSKAVGTPYVIPATGVYNWFACFVVTTTMPTPLGITKTNQNISNGLAPIACFKADTGQTTPPALGATLTLSGLSGQIPWVNAS
jgi:hypothetical protein